MEWYISNEKMMKARSYSKKNIGKDNETNI